ncbi:5-formyltetrahydrofolate cyclo-ligase, mitochondrial [Typha latifolia]|uniref:5-formyltetrahydrofolate cyclo-ligase, mitochondrial n=1 Tax=Typha latifolia TaxID=4733 RepID=UPI003C2FF112
MRGDNGLIRRATKVMAHHLALRCSFHTPSFSSTSYASASSLFRAAISTTTTTTMSKSASDQKRALRSDIRKALKALPPAQRAQEDLAIQNIVLNSSWFKSSASLCAYISCEALREVDTSRIVAEVLRYTDAEHHTQVMKELYVPRVEDKNSNMRMLKISSTGDLIANSMNILEPSPIDANGNPREDVMLATHPVDIFLLPGVAFDKHGHRLGRGGGYYDVLLTKYRELAMERKWNQPLLVALAYSVQIMEEGVIPATPTDVPVDALVSPSGVIPISSAALEKM